MPGSTARTHEAERTRAPVSTTHRRQTPTGVWFCRWHRVGMLIPFMRAASKTVVPFGTRTGFPSMPISIIPGGVTEVVMLGANSHALHFSGARCRSETNPAGTLPLQNVRINLGAKMLQHGLNRRGSDLAEAADRDRKTSCRERVYITPCAAKVKK